jgi:hypothetical protein
VVLSELGASIRWGLRENWRPIVLYFLAPALLLPVIGVGGVLLFIRFGADRTSNAPNSASTPADARAAAMLELFACLRGGPDDCVEFDITLAFLDQLSGGTFTYTALTPTDPGEANADGQRRVKLAGLSTAQARAVGAAVARTEPLPGAASMTVAVVDGSLEAVTFDAAGSRGTVMFALDAGTYRLLSITYRPAREAGR